MKLPKLSPTSYALLGLLARRPHSAYDLNSAMQTSLIRVFWPRAESHVYSEPKKLLAHKLVSERSEQAAGRKRTVYTITASGRSALEKWLQENGTGELRTSSELMLKLLLAGEGPAGSGQSILDKSRDASLSDLEEAIAGIEFILKSPDAAVAGMPWNGIAINLMADMLIARYQWSVYALEAATRTDRDSSPDEKEAMGRKAYTLALWKMRTALKDKT